MLPNPTHGFTDLVHPIDSAEDRPLQPVGVRTPGEIVASAAANDEERAVQFFERLWQRDQIVLDASRDATRAP